MRDLFGERHCVNAARQRAIRIAEQPLDLRCGLPRAHPRIMATVNVSVRTMPLRVVDLRAFLTMRVRSRRPPAKESRGPPAVMGLQLLAIVAAAGRELQQPSGIGFSLWHAARTREVLPQTVCRLEQSQRVAALFGEIASARVGLCHLGRRHPLGDDIRDPQRKP